MCLGTQRSQFHVTQLWQANSLPSYEQASSYFMTTLRTAAVGIAVLSFIISLVTGDPLALTVGFLSFTAALILLFPADNRPTSNVIYMPSNHRRHYSYYPMQQTVPQIIPLPMPAYIPSPTIYAPQPPIPAFHQSFSHVMPSYTQRAPLRTRERSYPQLPTQQPFSNFGATGFNPTQRGTLRERSV